MQLTELDLEAAPETAGSGEIGGKTGLFASDPLGWAAGPTEAEAVATLEALNATRQLTPAQRLQARVIRSLAANIDRGNAKGRAVGNEAMQLMAALEALTADEDSAPTDSLPDDTRKLLDALSQPPIAPAWADPTAPRDSP